MNNVFNNTSNNTSDNQTITLPISKLTREYNGDTIYFNRYVFEALNKTNAKCYKWRTDEIVDKLEVGDMIECDDDMVVRCNKIRKYKETIFVYTNVALVFVKKFSDKNGGYRYHFSKLLGGYTPLRNDRGAMVGYPISMDSVKKKVFVSLITNGIHPYKAYRTAYKNKRSMTPNQLNNKVLNLLMDKEVMEEINNNKIELRDKISEAFSDERMVMELMDLLEKSKKGTDAHRENIKFVLALLGKLPDTMIAKKTKSVNAIEVTPYEEVPPPALE